MRTRIADRLPPQRRQSESITADEGLPPAVAPANDEVRPQRLDPTQSLELLSMLNTEMNRRLDQQ